MFITTSTSSALNYAITTNPDPLQVNSTASITVVAAKQDRRTVSYSELTIKVSYSTDPNSAAALTADLGNIALSPPPNWTTASDEDGGFNFMPQPGYERIQPDDTLLFVVSGISVNQQVGSTTVTLIEKATINGSLQSSSLSFVLGKFPQGFALSELSATSPMINPGGSTTLIWMGSPGDYELQYGGNAPIQIPQQENFSSYSYTVDGLLESTILNLSVTASGGTVQTQRQYTVTVVRPEILSFEAANHVTELRTGAPVTLSWQTVNATACDLYINGVLIVTGLPASSSGYEVQNSTFAPGMASFVLVAYGNSLTQAVRAVLPVFMYRFELLPQLTTVGPMPYQLVLRPDSARLYVVCQYPYVFGNFAAPVNPPLSASGDPGLYVIDTYNFTSTQVVEEGGAIPNSDPRTQCITRLAVHPLDTYRFIFVSNQACIVDIDSNNPNQVPIIVPYTPHSIDDVAVGIAGNPRLGNIYPVITSQEDKSLEMKYLQAQANAQNDQFVNAPFNLENYLPVQPPDGQSEAWMVWSIAAISQIQLVTFSVAAYNAKFLVRATNGAATLVSISNFLTGLKFPPAVTFLTNSNALYCVSGVDASVDHQPVIVIMGNNDQEVRRIPVPAEVRTVVASPDGYHLYASLDDNTIIRMQIGAGTNQVIDTIDMTSIGVPWALAINPEGSCLYVGDVVNPTATSIPNGIIRVIEISDGAF